MELGEHTLLNRPALMLCVLRTAAHGETSVATCLEQLKEDLARARERLPENLQDVVDELERVIRHFLAARVLVRRGHDRFVLTERGRQILAAHPMGIDDTILAQFPEFRAYIHQFARNRTLDDPRIERYQDGRAAYRAGWRLADNPYQPDSIDHLAWANGWCEARDEDLAHRRNPSR
mgnify:CR=1 FL=1